MIPTNLAIEAGFGEINIFQISLVTQLYLIYEVLQDKGHKPLPRKMIF